MSIKNLVPEFLSRIARRFDAGRTPEVVSILGTLVSFPGLPVVYSRCTEVDICVLRYRNSCDSSRVGLSSCRDCVQVSGHDLEGHDLDGHDYVSDLVGIDLS